MGLHDRLSKQNGNGAAGATAERPVALAGPVAHHAASPASDPGASDPYAELKSGIHHAVIAKLGPELFKRETARGPLRARAPRRHRAARARPDPADARGAPADRPRDRRRRARLRPARAVAPRRLRHRGDGQQPRPDLRRARRAASSATDASFVDNAHLLRIIDKIVSQVGRRIDESSPMVDARLPDGSRVNAIIPPLSLRGPTLTIRKFSRDPYTMDDLINFNSLTPQAAQFLAACVKGKLNVLISGGTGTGKTTMLNAMSSFVPGRRADRHDRGRGRAPAPAGARDHARVAPAEHRGPGRDPHPRARPQRPAHAPRPDHRRRGPRRRDPGHAPGDEHGPRGLADDDPRELAARRALPPRDAGADRRRRPAAAARSASRSRARSTCSCRSRASSTAPAGSRTSPRCSGWSPT